MHNLSQSVSGACLLLRLKTFLLLECIKGMPWGELRYMEKQHQILLVDDSKVTVDGLKSHLSRNYRVHTAFTGLDALKVFEKNRRSLALVITDMVMPDISGVALISMIKAESPVTPVIAMTGWGQNPSALAAEVRADMVLIKPFELEELDKSISKLLSSKT